MGVTFSFGFTYFPSAAALSVLPGSPLSVSLAERPATAGTTGVGIAGTPKRIGTYRIVLLFAQGSRTDYRFFNVTVTCPQRQAPSIHGDGTCVPAATVPSGCSVSTLGATSAWWGRVYHEDPHTAYGSSAPQACTSLSESGRRAAYWRFTVPAHQEPGGMPARVHLEVGKRLDARMPGRPQTAGHPSLTLWKYDTTVPFAATRAVRFVASETSRQGAWHPTLDVSLVPGDYLIEVAPTRPVSPGRFNLSVTVPTAEKVHKDVTEVGNTGLNGDGMILAKFLDARGSLAKSRSTARSDTSDPTSPTHPWLAFTADWCSIPLSSGHLDLLESILNALSGDNLDVAQYIKQEPSFGGVTVPFYYACLRHDFNWRDLHRTKHHFQYDADGVWNSDVRDEADERFKQDLQLLCRANQMNSQPVPDNWDWTLSKTSLETCERVADEFQFGVSLELFGRITYAH